MGKVRVGLCVAGVVLVLAGCSTRVGGRPVGSDAPAEALNIDMFDDLSTVDPCSLTGPAAFEEYGIATMPGKPTFDECAVKVATDEGRVTVRLGEWQTEDALPEGRSVVATLDDGTSIVHVGRDCDMALVLGDGGVVLTSVEASGTVVPSDDVLCGLTQGAARGVHDVAAGGRVEHWDDLPRNSFGRVAACEVLDDEEVAAAIGDTSARSYVYPAGHQCRWGSAGGETPTAKLDFPVVETPQDAGVPDSAALEPIGGRQSWVVDTTTESLTVCTVLTEHIDFRPGLGTKEYAALRVAIPTGGVDACTAARTLAGKAWQDLPD